jgi:hypothetical protein
VSAGSHKLTAFNTISRALETSRKGGPVTAADVEAPSSSLISARDSLVKVRPQYGKVSTPARQDQRSANIASTTVVIYGLIGAMSTVYAEHIDPDVAFKELVTNDDGADIFAWDNEIWSRAGVVTPSGPDSGTLTTATASRPAGRRSVFSKRSWATQRTHRLICRRRTARPIPDEGTGLAAAALPCVPGVRYAASRPAGRVRKSAPPGRCGRRRGRRCLCRGRCVLVVEAGAGCWT